MTTPKIESVPNSVCPNCGGKTVVKYINYEAFYGCLECDWRMKEE